MIAKSKFCLAAIAALAAGPSLGQDMERAAYGFCFQPNPPTAFLSKPNKPFCAASRSCSQFEVDNYRREIDRHFRDLESYADQVDAYYADAVEYIRCMSELD